MLTKLLTVKHHGESYAVRIVIEAPAPIDQEILLDAILSKCLAVVYKEGKEKS